MGATRGLILSALATLLLGASGVQADPIEPGLDLYKTKPGLKTKLTLDKLKGNVLANPLVVKLKGNPLKNNPLANNPLPRKTGGKTDTVIKRSGKPIPSGGKGSIPIELVGLSLKSKKPVKVAQKGLFDVFVTLNPKKNSKGKKDIKSHEDPNDGNVFNLFLEAFLQVDFLPLSIVTAGPQPFRELLTVKGESSGVIGFGHEPPPFYPTIPNQPINTFFADGFNFGAGGQGGRLQTVLGLARASVSEPMSLSLLGTGLVLIGLARRRRQSATA